MMKLLVLVLLAMCLIVAGVSGYYGNYTSFTYNITSGMGTQTDYQMKFILSNASGISGYYSGDNVIFTNGTTRPDWFDINATDGTGSPTPFWVATTSQTTKNVTAWINVPSIDVANTSTGRWYYGYAAQSSSTMNGLNTFPTLFDDFDGAALNTTQWTGTGTTTVGSGYLSLPSNSVTNRITSVKGDFSIYNISWESYIYVPALAVTGTGQIRIDNDTDSYRGHWFDIYNNATKGTFPVSISSSGTTYGVNTATNATNSYYRIKRNGGLSPTAVYNYGVDGTSSQTISTNYYTANTSNVAIFNGVNTGLAMKVYWTFIRKSVPTEPITSRYSLYDPASSTLTASFSQSPNPSSTGQSVTFTDTSTGTPVTWNWTINGALTNTTQNIAYTFTAAGTYYVDLNVTNATGSFSNYTAMHNVTNASGFTPQDIWMEGLYTQTFHITDSATGLPIPVIQLQDTAMQTYTTTNGTGYLTEPFGSSSVVFSATGYSSKSISYVFDSDATWDVQLTKATATPQQSVWYTPWQVRFRIVDYYGKPLPGTNVTANYIASTLPSTDPNWLVGAFGVGADVAADMLNSSMAMTGVTDDNGGLSFTMFKSIQYSFLITNTTSGVSSTKNIYPSDSEYVIYVRTTGQIANNNTLATRNATLPWYSVNSTHINLNMTYIDTSLCTSQLVFRVWFRDNGTEVHNTTWSGFGASKVFDNHTVAKAPIGTEYLWGYNATTVC